MKNVLLKELELRNFKGIQSIKIPFTKETEIHGKNGIGKTTIADAYFWLLYGKNSLDQSDFEIKTLDKFNKAIPKLEHEVFGLFEVDGSEIKLSRVLKEKWVKKRGSETEEMTGHETTYFVNDVPTSAGDYKKKVSEIIEESISKIITNPYFFNEKTKWQDRRLMLSTMAGEVTNEMILDAVANPGNDFGELINIINSGKEIDDEKKVIGAKKKKLKDEIEQIPSRLDENNRQCPEELNWEELKSESAQLDLDVKSNTEKIDNINVSIQKQKDEILRIQTEKFKKEQQLETLYREQTSKISEDKLNSEREIKELEIQIKELEFDVEKYQGNNSLIEKTRLQKEEENTNLRIKKATIQESEFVLSKESCVCPTCKQDLLNASEIEETLKSNFNTDKLQKIEAINKQGFENKDFIEKAVIDIQERSTKITEALSKIEEIKLKIVSKGIQSPSVPVQQEPTAEMIALKKEIDSIEIPEIHSEETSLIRQEIETINAKKREIDSKLLIKDQIEKIKQRTNDLKEQQRTLSQELAGLEKIEIQIDRFNKAKINFIEERINSKFKFVKFKMFEDQLNGGESPACECIVNGVPYSDLNTAMKINASLDIINAFQYHFGIFAPVFIDGRESVTVITPTECQVISLVVNPNEEQLKVINV